MMFLSSSMFSYLLAQDSRLNNYNIDKYTLSSSVYGEIHKATTSNLTRELQLVGDGKDYQSVMNLLIEHSGLGLGKKIVFESEENIWVDYESFVYDFGLEKASFHTYYTLNFEFNRVSYIGVSYCIHFTNSKAKFRGFFLMAIFDDYNLVRAYNYGDQELYSTSTLICYDQYTMIEDRNLLVENEKGLKVIDLLSFYIDASNNFKVHRKCH